MTAYDLPAHGDSAALRTALTPAGAAAAVAGPVAAGTATAAAPTVRPGYDLVLGHSFGAAVALALVAQRPGTTARLVLEEPPGPTSVDWASEASAVRRGAWAARRDIAAAVLATRRDQPRWDEQDCRHAVTDLARCAADDVAAGLRRGASWAGQTSNVTRLPMLLLLAPDAPGVNRLEDATALRGPDRRRLVDDLGAEVTVLDAGHCPHRDDPAQWLAAVSRFAE